MISAINGLNTFASVAEKPVGLAIIIISIIALVGGAGAMTGTTIGYTLLGLGAGDFALNCSKLPYNFRTETPLMAGGKAVIGLTYQGIFITLASLAAFGILAPTIPAWFIVGSIGLVVISFSGAGCIGGIAIACASEG